MSDMGYWNYRLVNMPSTNGGEDYLVLCEVHYNADHSLYGYTPVDRVGGSLKEVRNELNRMAQAVKRPILHEDDPQVGRWNFNEEIENDNR